MDVLSPTKVVEGREDGAMDLTLRARPRSMVSTAVESESRYRGLMEAAPDAMVVVDQAGAIVLLNLQAEKQFGYRRGELVGQQVKNIIPEGFAERLIADDLRSAADALEQQMGTGIELIARRKDGSEFPIEIMLSPLENAEGILVTAAIRDISVRKAAEATLLQKVEELNRSNEELGQFAYIASHDLQEPLRMVASYTQLLSKRYKGRLDADADDFIAFAVDGASRMQQLIQDLLTYSRVGTKGMEMLETSSEDALFQALINLRGAVEDSAAVVTHDALPRVMADRMQLIQLFQNLVGNAIKYQSPGVPRVHVSAARDDKTDSLRGVFNRRGLDRALAPLASSGRPLTAAMIDVDHFKAVNDRFGHADGDRVLKRISDVLGATVRRTDVVARYGGEEFVVILSDSPIDVGLAWAERARTAIEAPEVDDGGIRVTASGGVAQRRDGESFDDLLARADSALYEAKADGRNRVRVSA